MPGTSEQFVESSPFSFRCSAPSGSLRQIQSSKFSEKSEKLDRPWSLTSCYGFSWHTFKTEFPLISFDPCLILARMKETDG